MTLFLITAILVSTLAGAPAAGNGWYVKRNNEHKQPALDAEFSFIEELDAYYVDRRHGDADEDKVLYLTFDAGYENGNIEKILDTLKKENVSAAFFILDNLILRNQALVERMADEGHLVCNHTLRHKDMSRITEESDFMRELTALSDLYREKTGREMAKYYRPPEGRFCKENLVFAKKNGYKTIFWSLAYADWDNKRQPDPEAAIRKLLENTHNGAVILLHPTSATNATILPVLIARWRELGYRFGTLDELTAKGVE